MRRALGCLVVLGCMALPGPALASDSWTAPSELSFDVTETLNTTAFGVQSFEPTAARPPDCRPLGKTAWWRVVGNGQQITLSTVLPATTFDTVLSVFTGAPPSPSFLACNDNHPADVLNRSQVSFASARGTAYLVQVGGWDSCVGGMLAPCPEFGTVALRATTALRPVNDDRANATPVTTGGTAASDNTGASQERGEDATCDGVPFAATVWHRWSAPAIGDASFHASATFTNTVLAVYRADSGARVGCNDDVPGSVGPSRLDLRVAPGDYLVQVGARGADGPATGQGGVSARVEFVEDRDADDDGVSLPDDCNDAAPGIRPGIADAPEDGVDQNCDGADAIDFDRDRDGYNRPGDCNDANPNIRPLVPDIAGNTIDEDCTGGPAPYPQLVSTVRTSVLFSPIRFTRITIQRAVAGSRVELRCRGRGCFRPARKVIRVRKSRKLQSLLTPAIRRARLKRGAVLEIRITKSGHVGFVRRVTVRGQDQSPKLDDLCLPVGKVTPKRC